MGLKFRAVQHAGVGKPNLLLILKKFCTMKDLSINFFTPNDLSIYKLTAELENMYRNNSEKGPQSLIW